MSIRLVRHPSSVVTSSILVAFVVLLGIGLSSSRGTQADVAKLLIGKWSGEIQGSFTGNRARVLVIDTVSEGTAAGRFGVTDNRLGRIQIAVHQTAGEVALEFTVSARAVLIPWKLKLASPGVLVGTVYEPVRGPAGRVEYPVTFRKVE